MNPPARNRNYTGLLVFIGLVLILFSAYAVFSAERLAQTTGILKVGANKPRASISISQDNREAVIIGSGQASTHLPPGTYHLAASLDGTTTTAIARINKGEVTRIILDFGKSFALPSIQNIDFQGTDNLVNSGLSSSQLHTIELAIFQFKPLTKKVVVNPASVKPAPHNLVADGAVFKINFSVSVDSKKYNAVVAYSGLNTARLLFYDTITGSVVFDSASISPPAG